MTVKGSTRWRKASASTGGSTNCIELAWARAVVGYRDSKQVDGPQLWFPASAGRSLVEWVRKDGT